MIHLNYFFTKFFEYFLVVNPGFIIYVLTLPSFLKDNFAGYRILDRLLFHYFYYVIPFLLLLLPNFHRFS